MQNTIAISVFYSFIMAMTVSAFAAGRNRRASVWFVIGLVCSLPALLVVLAMSRGTTALRPLRAR